MLAYRPDLGNRFGGAKEINLEKLIRIESTPRKVWNVVKAPFAFAGSVAYYIGLIAVYSWQAIFNRKKEDDDKEHDPYKIGLPPKDFDYGLNLPTPEQLNPSVSEIKSRLNEAQQYITKGSRSKALEMLIEMEPKTPEDRAEHHYLMSQIRFKEKEYEEAVRHVKEAVELNSNKIEYVKYLRNIEAYHTWTNLFGPILKIHSGIMKLLTDRPKPRLKRIKPADAQSTAEQPQKDPAPKGHYVFSLEAIAANQYKARAAYNLGKESKEHSILMKN